MDTDKNFADKDLTKKIIGACFEVSNELGSGFIESVYENALVIALSEKGLKVESQNLCVSVSICGFKNLSFYPR